MREPSEVARKRCSLTHVIDELTKLTPAVFIAMPFNASRNWILSSSGRRRVLLERALPAGRDRIDRRERHALPLIGGVRARNRDRGLRDATDFVRGHDAARREAPGAVDEHADAEAEVLVARDVLHLLLARGDRFER